MSEHKIEYHPFMNGVKNKKWEGWFLDDKLHREGKSPALIEYNIEGKKESAYWYHKGQLIKEYWYLEDGTVSKWDTKNNFNFYKW